MPLLTATSAFRLGRRRHRSLLVSPMCPRGAGWDRRLLTNSSTQLAVTARIKYKLCLLADTARVSHSPKYVADLLTPVAEISARSALCTSTHGDLAVWRPRLKFENMHFLWHLLWLRVTNGPSFCTIRYLRVRTLVTHWKVQCHWLMDCSWCSESEMLQSLPDTNSPPPALCQCSSCIEYACCRTSWSPTITLVQTNLSAWKNFILCTKPDSDSCYSAKGKCSSFTQRNKNKEHMHTTILRPFFQDYMGELVPEEEIFWTLWYKGRYQRQTSTIRLGATPSRLISDPSHSSPYFYIGCPSCTTLPIYPGLEEAPNMQICLHTQWLGIKIQKRQKI